MSLVADKLKQLPWITCLFGAAVFLVALIPDSIASILQYDRDRILHGELWRLFTGHFVHWNAPHMVWDMIVFVACAAFLEWIRRGLLISVLTVGPFLISGVLLFLQTDMETYRGLSALDMSLFTMVSLQAISYSLLRGRKALVGVWSLVLLGCFLKPLLEVFMGKAFFVSDFGVGVVASPISHMLGILAALGLFTTISAWRKLQNPFVRIRSFQSHKLSGTSIS